MFGDINKKSLEGNVQQTTITQEESQLMEKREGVAVSIRREGRQNEISKRRKQNVMMTTQEEAPLSPFEAKLREYRKMDFNIAQLQQLGQCLTSQDVEKAHFGIIGIRKILSTDKDPPIQLVIDANLVPKIITFAKQDQYLELKSQATWCLSNIASGSSLQTQSVVDKGGIQLFAQLLTSKIQLVVQNAVWAIGNIAGDRAVYRDNLLKYKALQTLCNLIDNSQNMKIVTQSVWCISNIIKCKPTPKFEQCKIVIPVLANMILKGNVTSLETIAQSISVFSWLIEYNNSRIALLMQTGIAPRLIQFLSSDTKEIVSASIKTLGNICFGNQLHIQTLLDNGFIQQLDKMFDQSKVSIKRQICWALSNVVASLQKHVKFVFDHQSLVTKVLDILRTKQRFQLQLEAGVFFSNIASKGDPYYIISFFHNSELMRIYLQLLSHQQNSIVQMSLLAIGNCLSLGQKTKQQFEGKSIMMNDLIANKGIDLLEESQMHPNNKIYKITAQLLSKYFEIEDPLQ